MGWPIRSLCQIAAVKGADALQDPHDDARGGVAAVAFEVELAFERVVDRFDDLAQWFEDRLPGRCGSPWRAGRSRQMWPSARTVSNRSRSSSCPR